MTDYTTPTGTGGTLIIRDNGSTITYLIQNTNGSTFVSGASWSGIVNGVAVGGTYSISGAQTVTVGSWTVSTTQNIQFNIAATGTSGLGGPTTLNHTVSRATVPGVTSPIGIDQVDMVSFRYRFSSGSNGGSAIDQYQIGYGTNAGNPTTFLASGGTSTITGLSPGTTYYVWSRAHNAIGWSPWSARLSTTTAGGAKYKSSTGWKSAIPWVKVAGIWKKAQPWVKVSGVWKKTT
jgi:hypothetical protein